MGRTAAGRGGTGVERTRFERTKPPEHLRRDCSLSRRSSLPPMWPFPCPPCSRLAVPWRATPKVLVWCWCWCASPGRLPRCSWPGSWRSCAVPNWPRSSHQSLCWTRTMTRTRLGTWGTANDRQRQPAAHSGRTRPVRGGYGFTVGCCGCDATSSESASSGREGELSPPFPPSLQAQLQSAGPRDRATRVRCATESCSESARLTALCLVRAWLCLCPSVSATPALFFFLGGKPMTVRRAGYADSDSFVGSMSKDSLVELLQSARTAENDGASVVSCDF